MTIMKNILWLWCSLCALSSFSQYAQPIGATLPKGSRTVDSAYLTVSYRLWSVKNSGKPKETRYEDVQTLQIGTEASKFYSQYLVNYYEKVKSTIAKGARSVENNPYRGSYAYEVFRNYPQNGTVTVDELGDFSMGQYYLYEEPQPRMEWKWQMQATFDTVLGYVCQKATTCFRGRDYMAWFALKLPIPLGPWKFGGLPGLILKLEDSQKHYAWEAIGIERPKTKIPIEFRSGIKFTKLSRADLDKLYRRYHKDPDAYWNAAGGESYVVGVDGKATKVTSSPALPYNPIELE